MAIRRPRRDGPVPFGGCGRADPERPQSAAGPRLDATPPALTPVAKRALDTALADERQSLLTYRAVMARFGEVRPFSNIAAAEERHIAALTTIYRRYGASVPGEWPPTPPPPRSLREACHQAVDAEIANASLYETALLPAVTSYPDITAVMVRLRDASQFRHLPAFQRCLQRRQ